MKQSCIFRALWGSGASPGPLDLVWARPDRRRGTQRPSLSRDQIDLIVDAVYCDAARPERASGDWRHDLSTVVHQTRLLMSRHPWLAALAGNRALLGPNALHRGLSDEEFRLSAAPYVQEHVIASGRYPRRSPGFSTIPRVTGSALRGWGHICHCRKSAPPAVTR